jgi:uncharacterized protein (TIGR03435 family)
MLSGQVGDPVIDKTGLSGKYDFNVEFSLPDSQASQSPGGGGAVPAPVSDLGMDLVAAIQQQLGLRLEKGKGMLDYVVVEKAEKVPTEN